jgi:hypothetical protein
MTKKEAKEIIGMLEEAPMLIRLAKEMIAYLPKGNAKNELIRNLIKVKKSLISLDVCLQDIEWSISRYQVLESMKNDDKNLTKAQGGPYGSDLHPRP